MTASPARNRPATRIERATGRHTTTSTRPTRGDLMNQSYSADEVRALLYAAYVHGRHDADVNELHATWAERQEPRLTRERRVAARITQMEETAARQPWNTWRGQYPGGPVDFETGQPQRRLGAVA